MLMQRINRMVLVGPFFGLQVPTNVYLTNRLQLLKDLSDLDQDLKIKLLDHLHKQISVNWIYSHKQNDNARKRTCSHQIFDPSQTAPTH